MKYIHFLHVHVMQGLQDRRTRFSIFCTFREHTQQSMVPYYGWWPAVKLRPMAVRPGGRMAGRLTPRPPGHTAIRPVIRPYGHTANITAIMAIFGLPCINSRNTDKIDKIRAHRTPHTVGVSLPCGHLAEHKTQNQYFSIHITLTCT